LKGIGARILDPVELQNTWVAGGAPAARGGGARGASGNAVTVSVTPASGQRVEGRLVHIDDFVVTLVDTSGSIQSFARSGDAPKVELHDPKAAHKKLLPTYADKDIHDVTAYLVTLK
jgi:cytochrome c oxidase cbb3-type subunit 3